MVKAGYRKIIGYVMKGMVTALLCSLFIWRIPHEYEDVKLRLLNHLLSTLSFSDLSLLETGLSPADPAVARQFSRYFQYVAEFMPGRADAWAMVGFCEAKLNRPDPALAAYEKAAGMDTHIAWVYYNLGALYLKQGSFIKAQANFKKAIDVPVEANVIMVQNSKVYLDILRQCPQINMEDRLKGTYTLSYQLVRISARMGEAGGPALSDLDLSWTAPRIF